jgi:hypothetical protein
MTAADVRDDIPVAVPTTFGGVDGELIAACSTFHPIRGGVSLLTLLYRLDTGWYQVSLWSAEGECVQTVGYRSDLEALNRVSACTRRAAGERRVVGFHRGPAVSFEDFVERIDQTVNGAIGESRA